MSKGYNYGGVSAVIFDLSQVIKKAFHIYANEEGIEERSDLSPFYQLENVNMKTSTATYLTKVRERLIMGISCSFLIFHL